MLEEMQRDVVKRWIKLAKKDLRAIKKHKRFTNADAFTIGQIDVEVLMIQDWIEELNEKNKL
jgi:hypothetical protein